MKCGRFLFLLFAVGITWSCRTATYVEAKGNEKPDRMIHQNIYHFGLVLSPYNEDWADPESIIVLLKELGVKSVISRMGWKFIEKRRGLCTWREYDEFVDKLTKAGISVTAMITSTPTWAIDPDVLTAWKGKRPGDPPPSETKYMADFVRVAAKRYKGKIKFWALYNEVSQEKDRLEPEALADLYKAVYGIIKEEDSTNTVIMSSLGTKNREEYFERFLKAGGGEYVDMYDFHEITMMSLIEPAMDSLKRIMRQYQQEKPVQLGASGDPSEFKPTPRSFKRMKRHRLSKAWDINEPRTLESQAQRLVKRMAWARALGIKRVFWVRTRDARKKTMLEVQQSKRPKWKHISGFYTKGIIRNDLTPKPAFYAFKNVIEKLDTALFYKSVDTEEPSKGYVFKTGNKHIALFWTWEGKKLLKVKTRAKSVMLKDKYDNLVEKIDVKDGILSVEVTTDPLFVYGDVADITN